MSIAYGEALVLETTLLRHLAETGRKEHLGMPTETLANLQL